MGTNNVVFMEVLEWFDDSGNELAHRLPQEGSGELKLGAQAIVRDSQAAVFFSGGVACDALGPGRHTLSTKNIPILTKLLSLPWAFTSPFRAEVYFVNLKVFNNLKWGTRDPVAFRDKELGLVRLRAHGVFNIQVTQPVLFINSLVGTKNSYSVEDMENYLNEVIISRLNDHLGENLDTLLDLPSRYEDIATGLSDRLKEDLAKYGLSLKDIYINAITPPAEVQKAIDDKTRLSFLADDLNSLIKMKTAMAMEKASESTGSAGEGVGLAMGLMMPGLFSSLQSNQSKPSAPLNNCPDCGLPVENNTRFCPHCGHQILLLRKCEMCGKNLGPKAKFCPACGSPATTQQHSKVCSECNTKNRPEAVFCNQCGAML
jgi:membrane protease subunit (stomatin/prohibitin family)